MADVSVRPARADDLAEIARIHVETWKWGYREILPADALDALSVEAALEAWGDAVTAPPSTRHHVLVALEQTWRVGFVAVTPAEDLEDDDPDPLTTAAVGPLLVEPRWARRGHGSRLLAAAIDHARSDGMTRAIAWLPQADTASQEFLSSAGWAPDGLARVLDTGAGEVHEIRMHVLLLEAA
ncbi:MAG TPA: GNAT family N-acetyltransferase [Jatrophihabitantaceae bacterium]|nr:GNAT family N-acetyltransferase [Jatrophihabitantaceae bacterium]